MKLNLFKGKEAKNAGWIIGGKIVQMLFSLVVGILTARYLGPGNYGLISYGAAYISFFSALCTLGLNSIIVKELIDKPDEQGTTLGSAIILRLLSSALSSVMIIGIVAIVDRDEPLTIAVVALSTLGLVFHVFEIINFWFQAQYKSKITSIATLIAYIIMSAYKLVILYLGKDVKWFAVATAVDYIVIAIFLLIAYKMYKGQAFGFSFARSKSLLKSSYHYILSSMMVAIYGQTDKLMLKQMLNETEVGYYSTASAVCGMWVFVLQAIIDSMYPTILRLYSKDEEEYKRKNRQLYAIVFYVSVIVSVLFLIFGNLVIKILYGEEFMDASGPLKIVTWYTAFSYLGVARNAWIVSEGKQKYLKYIYAVAAGLNVVLNLIFIPIWGASGAAFASLVTQVFTSIILPMCIKDLRPNAKLMIEAIAFRKIK